MASKQITGIVNWLKNWFYDKGTMNTLLGAKANVNQGQANYNVVTNASGDITVEPKPTIDTALSSNSENAVQNKVINSALSGKANSSHTHTTSQVTDPAAHTFILQTSANATQSNINSQIDFILSEVAGAVDNLSNIRLVKVVTGSTADEALGTASQSTMDTLYVYATGSTTSKNLYGIYVTIKDGNNFRWEKIDDADLQGFLTQSDIVNGLAGGRDKALAAEMGVVLKSLIDQTVVDIELVPASQDSSGAIKLIFADTLII